MCLESVYSDENASFSENKKNTISRLTYDVSNSERQYRDKDQQREVHGYRDLKKVDAIVCVCFSI